MSDLNAEHCLPCEGDTVVPLSENEILQRLAELPDWELDAAAKELSRAFGFKDFHQVMAFANAVAWIAHQKNHHPEMELSYRRCTVRFSTHAVNGLTQNDFICAYKVQMLLHGA